MSILYEVVLYFIPIPLSVYRICALRYTLHLASGMWIYEIVNRNKLGDMSKRSVVIEGAISIMLFISGSAYILFFIANRENTHIFPYTIWGNTNAFSCLYIGPVFYIIMRNFRYYRIKVKWIHFILTAVAQNTYYILCTQMMWFWGAAAIWRRMRMPMVMQIVANICIGCISGIILGRCIRRLNIDKH